jgi:hypothetical protein
MMRVTAAFIAMMFTAVPSIVAAQLTGTIAGRIVDSTSREGRAGARAAVVGTGRSATSGADGRFVITGAPVGDQRLSVTSPDARPTTIAIRIRAGDTTRVEIVLSRRATMLAPVTTDAHGVDRQAFVSKTDVGAIRLGQSTLAAVPRLGESDVIRVVQLLPGVQAKNDFSTGFSVHGGESDQNLILLDGYPVYNPFHVGGLFSTFISSGVHDVELLTGGFPARYGDRLSSVLDVHSSDDDRPGIHASSDVSVVAASTTLSGMIGNGLGSWSLGGRRTYADQVVQLFSSERVPYHFRDEQAHIALALPGDAHFSASLYDGRDILDADFAQLPDSLHQGSNGGAFYVSWGNLVGGATISKAIRSRTADWFGDSLVLAQRVSTSRFSTLFDIAHSSATFETAVTDNRIGGTATRFSRAHDTSIGYEATEYDVTFRSTTAQGSVDDHSSRQQPFVGAAYYDDLWRAGSSLLVSDGLRVESETGRNSTTILPRFSLKYLWSPDAAFTASFGRYAQSMHSLALEDSPIRLFDVWHASDADSPVSTSWQIVGGHERWFGRSRSIRVEGFYKRYANVLEYNVEEDPSNDHDDFVPANGTSYGVDVMVRQVDAGRFNGWIAYSYAMNTRERDGHRYVPGNDRRHDLNVVGTWRAGGFTVGARVGYASGLPYTEMIAEIERRLYDPVRGSWGSGGGRAWNEDVGADRNGARLPPTRRIDVFAQRSFTARGATISPYASVVNAANAKNVLFYVYDFTTSPGTRRAVSQFPIVPSAGVSVAF